MRLSERHSFGCHQQSQIVEGTVERLFLSNKLVSKHMRHDLDSNCLASPGNWTHHHHHPRISWRHKSQTKLQDGRRQTLGLHKQPFKPVAYL